MTKNPSPADALRLAPARMTDTQIRDEIDAIETRYPDPDKASQDALQRHCDLSVESQHRKRVAEVVRDDHSETARRERIVNTALEALRDPAGRNR